MTPRKTDYRARKDRVLAIVVDQYTQRITPVSSAYLVKEYFYGLSPATIRNILSELEDDGFLTHPHTSAGRVPTQKGYRYYVDHLMNDIQLLEEEKRHITAQYQAGIRELETLMEKTSQVISELTSYTSIVSVDGENQKVYCHGISFVAGYPEFQNFAKIEAILKFLGEKQKILEVVNRELHSKIEFFIGQECEHEVFEGCSLAVSKFQRKNGLKGRIALLGPTRMDYERVVCALDYLTDVLQQY